MRTRCLWNILILTLLLLIPCTRASARVYLVSAGISDYPGEKNDLRLPAADARTIAGIYSRNGQAAYRLLVDQQATRANIVNAMQSVFSQAREDDIVVFFFSGHGVQGGFVAYDGVLNYDQIRHAMSKSKSRHKMIFADACFSGKIRTGGSNSSRTAADARKANVMLFLSSRSNEVSIERADMANGFFTDCLQRGLRGGADINHDRIITAKELFNYVYNGVLRLSAKKQHPVMWGRFPDNMPVIKW